MANINYNNLAMDIYKFCRENEMWDDTAIFFDGKALASWDEWKCENGIKVADALYLYENENPRNYMQYINPDGLSCMFDGNFGLHTLVNDWGATFPVTYEKFCSIFEKYGLYFEIGHSWYITTAEL